MLRPYLTPRTHPGDPITVDQHSRIAQDFHLAHLVAAAGARGAAAGHDLTRADEERLQSGDPPSRIGKRMPCRRAAASASG